MSRGIPYITNAPGVVIDSGRLFRVERTAARVHRLGVPVALTWREGAYAVVASAQAIREWAGR